VIAFLYPNVSLCFMLLAHMFHLADDNEP